MPTALPEISCLASEAPWRGMTDGGEWPFPPASQGAMEEVRCREVVQSFHPEYLGLALGERVSVRRRGRAAWHDKGWLYGTTIDGRQGWFPSGAVEAVCREVVQAFDGAEKAGY